MQLLSSGILRSADLPILHTGKTRFFADGVTAKAGFVFICEGLNFRFPPGLFAPLQAKIALRNAGRRADKDA